MLAKQALEYAKEHVEKQQKGNIDTLIDLIRIGAKAGRLSMKADRLYPEQKKHLEQLGYEVKRVNNAMTGSHYVISWNKAE